MTSTEGALEVFSSGGLTFRFTPEELKAWVTRLDEVRRSVLVKGTDYDVIPGGRNQDNLLKPGAEKLIMIAGLGVHMCQIPTTAGHDGLTYRCSVFRQQPGSTWACGQCGETASVAVIAQCEGYAGYDEDRYFQTAIGRKAKAESDERHWAAKDHRDVRPERWAGPFEDYKAPLNTLMKMAQKRAYVGATLNALAASGLFTQDLDDQGEAAQQAAAAGAAPYDSWAHLEPWFKLLTPDETARLRAWREAENKAGRPLEAPQKMTELMVERTLVQIGAIMAHPAAPPDVPAAAPQQAPQPPEAPPGGSNFPEAVHEATGAAQVDEIGSLDDADGSAEDGFSGDPFDASPPEPAVEPGRAAHFHRKAGSLKLKAEEHEAIITVASEGRTAHAGELTAPEMEFAEILLDQLAGGVQQIDVITGAAGDMRRAVQARHVVETRSRLAARS